MDMFKGFKKTAEDQHTATMAHPDGHTIKVAKGALSPKMRMQLSKLPLHQSDPQGAVPSLEDQRMGDLISEAADQDNIPPEPQHTPEEIGDVLGTQGVGPTVTGADNGIGSLGPGTSPTAAVSQMPGGDAALEANQGAVQAGTNLGNAQDKAYQQSQAAQAKAFNDFKASVQGNRQNVDQITQELLNGQIDPKHYQESMSSGQKITTAIGLLLGGISSARTGQPNPAMQFMQSQIDRDIKSQEMNANNKNTLLYALEQQYGDKEQAYKFAQAVMTNQLAAKLGSAAAQNTSAQAKIIGQQGVSHLQQQAALYERQAALIGLRNSINGGPTSSDIDARANLYRQALRATGDWKGLEDFEKHYVPGVAEASVPLEAKDRDSLQKKTELHDLLNRADDYLRQVGTLGAVAPGTKAAGQTLQNQINLKMGELSDLTRFTPEENKIYQQSVPDLTGTHFTYKDRQLLDGLKESNNKSLDTFYSQKGMPVKAGANDMITVIAPNGKSGKIPQSNLQKAVASGYKQVQ